MGVSIEDLRVVDRIRYLRAVPAAVRFLSCEPLLGPLDSLPLEGMRWVIVGGESGPRARPMRPEWVTSILEQCRSAGVAFFFKQWEECVRTAQGGSYMGELLTRCLRSPQPKRSGYIAHQR
jgi:protein gp37